MLDANLNSNSLRAGQNFQTKLARKARTVLQTRQIYAYELGQVVGGFILTCPSPHPSLRSASSPSIEDPVGFRIVADNVQIHDRRP